MDQQVVAGATGARAHANREPRVRRVRQAGVVEPRRCAFDARGFAREQVGDEALAVFEVGERVARRRIQQAHAEAQLAARRDRGRDTQRGRDLTRHPVHAAQSADERHDRAAVLGDREHGRLRALVGETRRDRADHDARRAERDDRRAACVQVAQMRAEFVISDIGPNAARETVHLRAGINRLDAPRGIERALTQYNNRDDRDIRIHARHFSPGTTSSEKYGDAIGSTSSSGTMR